MNNFPLFKKIVASICLSSILLCGPVGVAQAGVWGESAAAEIAHEAWRLIYDTIREMIIAKVKAEIAKRVDGVLRDIVLGGAFGEVVGDFYDEIFGGVLEDGHKKLDDYFKERLSDAPPMTQTERDTIDRVFAAAREDVKAISDVYVKRETGLMRRVAGPYATWDNVFSGEGGPKAVIANVFDNPNRLHSQAVEEVKAALAREQEAKKIQMMSTGGILDAEGNPGSGNSANKALMEELLAASKKLITSGGLNFSELATILSALSSTKPFVPNKNEDGEGDAGFDLGQVFNAGVAVSGQGNRAENKKAKAYLEELIRSASPANIELSEAQAGFQKQQAGVSEETEL